MKLSVFLTVAAFAKKLEGPLSFEDKISQFETQSLGVFDTWYDDACSENEKFGNFKSFWFNKLIPQLKENFEDCGSNPLRKRRETEEEQAPRISKVDRIRAIRTLVKDVGEMGDSFFGSCFFRREGGKTYVEYLQNLMP